MPIPISAQYTDTEHGMIRVTLDDERVMYVPSFDSNRHYRELQEYIAEHPDFTITEADPPSAVVAVVPKVSLVRAMRRTRLNGGPITVETQTSVWQATKQAVTNAPADVKEDWELMAVVPRDDTIIQHLVATLPWTGTQYTGDQIMDHIYDLATETP